MGLFFLLSGTSAWGAGVLSPIGPSSAVVEAVAPTLNAHKDGLSLLPIPFGGYDDTYGGLGGAALILYEPKTETRLTTSFLTNFNDYFRYKLRFEWIRPGQWIFDAAGSVGNDLQDYFGEGDNTSSAFEQLKSNLTQFIFSFQYQLAPRFYLGPDFQYLSRAWTNTPLFPNESEWKAGIRSTIDDRDNIIETRRGSYFQMGLYSLPGAGDNGFGAAVWQFEGDARFYRPILGNAVWVSRLNMGWSEGDPSYSFEYTLGGIWELRGYHTNRFRGGRFYAVQEEARFPLFNWLEGAASVDAGDVSDTGFSNLLWTTQIGLRCVSFTQLGLVLRLDWGFGNGGNALAISTNEPF